MVTEETPRPPRRLFGAYDGIVFALFVVFWLLPIVWVGSSASDVAFLPRYLNHLQRCACLFTHEVRNWKTMHVQVALAGDAGWSELPTQGYFDMEIFGYRTRLQRILSASFAGGPSGERTQQEVAEFIARRYRERHPDGREMVALRFVRARHPVAELARQRGHFVQPPLSEIPERNRQYFGMAWIPSPREGAP